MTPEQDQHMASIARELAHALCGFARERDDGHKKLVAQLHTDLCAAYRAENAADVAETEAAE